MSTVKVPLLIGTSGGTPIAAAPQRVYNYYSVKDNTSKEGVVWKNTPGWDTWTSVTNGAGRKGIVFQDNLYIVSGKKVTKITNASSGKLRSDIGTITTTTGQVNMAQDGVSLMITDGHQMTRWDGSTFSAVSIPFPNPTGIVAHDGFFVCLEGGSGRFWISDKFDGSTWSSLQFATAEDKPDNIQALGSDRTLFIFGTETTQPYVNDGQAFPFAPNQQGRMIYGMEGQTWAQLDNTSFWLARSKSGGLKVVKANGYTPQAVSTPSLENEFSLLSRTDDAYADSIMWDGHEWYILNFPTAKRTYVFDTNGDWFQWESWDDEAADFVGHPALDFIYFDGSYLFLDGTTNIKELKRDVYKHGDDVMSSVFITGVQHVDEQRVFLRNLIFDMAAGVGETATMEMAISRDAGRTFEWLEPKGLGAIGDYRHRVQWHHLGSGHNVVLKSRITAEVERQIIRGVIDVDVKTSYLQRRNSRAGIPAAPQ